MVAYWLGTAAKDDIRIYLKHFLVLLEGDEGVGFPVDDQSRRANVRMEISRSLRPILPTHHVT